MPEKRLERTRQAYSDSKIPEYSESKVPEYIMCESCKGTGLITITINYCITMVCLDCDGRGEILIS